MTNLNRGIERIALRHEILGILFLAFVFSGVLLTSVESHGQAVPPRVQALQMTRPVAPPPEPPIQKEIRELRQQMRSRDRELARKMELVQIQEFTSNQIERLKKKLSCFVDHLLANQLPADGMICGEPLPAGITKLEKFRSHCALRAQSLKNQIEALKHGVSGLPGGKQ